jgi:transcription elongation GreA/GreB family factor
MSDIKKRLYQHCLEFLNKRIASAREAIQMAQSSANEETKSSAGDKYETGRAMAQLEIEKSSAQLDQTLNEKKLLESINIAIKPVTIQNGSLVKTDQGNFFIAVSVGLVVIEGISYAIVSAQSPIGKLLIGKAPGELFSFGQKSYTVVSFE